MKKPVIVISLILVAGVGIGLSINASAEEGLIPDWIKNTAGWWSEGAVEDTDFINSMQWLIENKVLQVSTTGDGELKIEADKIYIENQELKKENEELRTKLANMDAAKLSTGTSSFTGDTYTNELYGFTATVPSDWNIDTTNSLTLPEYPPIITFYTKSLNDYPPHMTIAYIDPSSFLLDIEILGYERTMQVWISEIQNLVPNLKIINDGFVKLTEDSDEKVIFLEYVYTKEIDGEFYSVHEITVLIFYPDEDNDYYSDGYEFAYSAKAVEYDEYYSLFDNVITSFKVLEPKN